MRASMLRPTRPLRRNPYDNAVAQALHQWLTASNLLTLAAGGAAAPAGTTPKHLSDVAMLLYAGHGSDKGALLVVTQSDGDKTAWFHYGEGEWRKVNPDGSMSPPFLSDDAMQNVVDNTFTVTGGSVVSLGGYSGMAHVLQAALAQAGMVAAAPSASGLDNVAALPHSNYASAPGTLLLVKSKPSAPYEAWFHYKDGQWRQVDLTHGGTIDTFDEGEMQSWVTGVLANGGTVQNLGLVDPQLADVQQAVNAALGVAPAAPAPATVIVKSLPHADGGMQKGTLLLVTTSGGTKTAWFHYKPDDWSQMSVTGGNYASNELTEAGMQGFVNDVLAGGGTVQNVGFAEWGAHSDIVAKLANAAPAAAAPAAPTAPAGAASFGPWGTVLPKTMDWSVIPHNSVVVLFNSGGLVTVWFHLSDNDWSELIGGTYHYHMLGEESFAAKASGAAAAVLLPGVFNWDTKQAAVTAAVAKVPPLASLSVSAAPAAAAAAPVAPVSLDASTLGALQSLHDYIKGDDAKIGMAGAIMARIVKNNDDYFSSAYGSDFDGYGTPLGRTKFLTKLVDLGIAVLYGKTSGGKKAFKASQTGILVADAWVNKGYADPTMLGKKPKAAKAAAPAAAAAAAEVTAPVAAGPKSKQIASIADNLALLGPLIKEAAAKVTSVITDVSPNGIAMMMKDDLSSSVSLVQASTNSITMAYYKNSVVGAEKTTTLAVPDAAGMIAGSIAQAMVYFLVYSHESGGKVAVQPPPPLPDPVVAGGVPLVVGAEITTQGQKDALPPGSLVVGGVVRYFAYPNWDTYFKPVADPLAAVQQGIVFPAPKQPGWPAVQVAPTLAVYSELPVGTLLRTDFSGGSVFAARVDDTGYQKVDSGSGAVTSSTKRSPATLVSDAAKNKAIPYILFLGKGKVENGDFYKEWIEGKRIDNAETKAQQASALVEMLAEALGIDPRVAALFTTKALQAMIAQAGVPYMGNTFHPTIPATAKSPLLKNPRVLGGFRSNPERYRDTVRAVLRNARPTLRDLQDAELLEAAGLPLHDAVPRRRNPDGGLAAATDAESGIIKAIADALKAALGSGEKPNGSSKVGQQIDSKLGSMYGSGGNVRKETGSGLGAYLRYLVAARAMGLWKNYIDPGEREVTRGLSFSSTQANDPSQSVRTNSDGLTQIEVMKAAGLISTPLKPYEAMGAWLTKQASGSGWYREKPTVYNPDGSIVPGTPTPWIASSALKPPASYEGKMNGSGSSTSEGSIQHWNTYQRATGGGSWKGKLPFPAWAAEPWANVEGFNVDYHDTTFSNFTASEWSAPLFGFASTSSFLLRANTRDPRFVLLPGSDLSQGPMSHFKGEGAIVFVTIDEKPLKAEVVSVGHGGGHLTTEQLSAWIRARPAYPTGPKPVGPAQGVVLHRNPAPATTRLTMREVHAIVFPRAKWGPGAVRNWLAQRGMEGLQVAAAGGNWRVEVYGSAAFFPGTIRQRAVGDGVVALVGRPL